MDVEICGKVIGQCSGRGDSWDHTDQWHRFRAAPGDIPPKCTLLETDLKRGIWTAYDANDRVFEQGHISVNFTKT